MKIKIAHTRYEYDSYTDFRTLARLSGIEQCFVDNIMPDEDAVFITTPINGELRPHIDNHRDKPKKSIVVWWSLERPGGNDNPYNRDAKLKEFIAGNIKLINQGYVDYIWISDKRLVEQHNHPKIQFVIMGSDHRLPIGKFNWEVPINEKKWDYTHLSYQAHRRSNILDRFRVNDNRREHPNGWGAARDEGLSHSKMMINVHQDGHPINEPLRIALAAAYGIPYITEDNADSFPLVVHEHYLQTPWDNMVNYCRAKFDESWQPLSDMGKRLHQLLCYDHPFGKNILDLCRQNGWIDG